VIGHVTRLLAWAEVRPGQRYLDVGCGNGAVALGLDITGDDGDPAQVLVARSEGAEIERLRFLTGDATRLPFPDGEFAVVAASKLTHHIPRWEAAVAEMLRVLAPGGVFVHADLVYPRWLVAMGRRVTGGRAGFPTACALDALVERARLVRLHRSRSWGHDETVCRLPTGRRPSP